MDTITNCQLDLEMTTPVDELRFERLDEKFQSIHIISTVLLYLMFGALALLLLMMDDTLWCIIAECVILSALILNLTILRKAYLFRGYALREHDISLRRGVIFPTVTTIPYSRMQQVSIGQNPLSKIFNLYSVTVVNGAQTLSSLIIQGLTEETANQIKNLVTEKIRCEHD